MEQVIKLTSHYRRTSSNMRWQVGKTNSVQPYWDNRFYFSPLKVQLCAPGCLHAYRSIELAAFAKHIHCYAYTRAALCETSKIHVDDGLKLGCIEITPLRWIKLPNPTLAHFTAWAARCNLEYSPKRKKVRTWLNLVLDGQDTVEDLRELAFHTAPFNPLFWIAKARRLYFDRRHGLPGYYKRYCVRSVESLCYSRRFDLSIPNAIAISVLNQPKDL